MGRPAAVVIATVMLLGLVPAYAVIAVSLLGLAGPPPDVLGGLLGDAAPAATTALGIGAAVAVPVSVVAAVGVWLFRPWARVVAVVLLFGVIAACTAVAASGDGDMPVGTALAIGLLAGSALVGLLTRPAGIAFGEVPPPDPTAGRPPLEAPPADDDPDLIDDGPGPTDDPSGPEHASDRDTPAPPTTDAEGAG
jgi:hypothetical protein